ARLVEATSLREIVASWPFQLVVGYLIKPLAACALLRLWIPELFAGWLSATMTFLAASFVLNSRLALGTGESMIQALVQFYDLLRAVVVRGLIRLIVRAVNLFVDTVETVLFTVDEWLRFRTGDSKAAMAVRTMLALLWFPVSYVSRFYMVVLVEPGLNPIKLP